MGNCNFASEQNQDELQTYITPRLFNFLYVIGRGGFGKVWKVEHKKTKQLYAMKEMSKAKIITKKSINSVMNERYLLSTLKNPFIVNMVWAFQDRENLYLVMDLLGGGDLRYHIGRQRKFTEEQTKFFIACLVQALEYLHYNSVLHRDVKPENLVLDDQGYLRLTDLGVARIWKPDNQSDTSGTPGYMAPEVMCRQVHGVAADYYAVGVITYECMLGKRPYIGRTRKELRDQIIARQVQVRKTEIPHGWSLEAADFINKTIQRKPQNRLGLNGPDEVKEHPWLKDFPWQKLENRELESPFLPKSEDNFDAKQMEPRDKQDTNPELIQQNLLLLRRNSVQELFQGYEYEKEIQQNSNNFQTISGNNSTAVTARYTQSNTYAN
ncbi:hypothetical protein ABPG74_008889 [Tetrahymena malaccensis]